MEHNLTQAQRIVVATLYLLMLIVVYHMIGGSIEALIGKQSHNTIGIFSGALMIIIGAYIIEPFFTKPSDAIASSITLIVALLGIPEKSTLYWYEGIFAYGSLILVSAVSCIALKDSQHTWANRLSRLAFWFVGKFGRAKLLFTALYLSTAFSYLKNEPFRLIVALTFWLAVTWIDIGGWLAKACHQLLGLLNKKHRHELGTAIGCENPFLYRVEMTTDQSSRNVAVGYGHLVAIETATNMGSIGMVISKKHLVNKKWLSVYLFRNTNGDPIRIDLKPIKLVSDTNSIFTQTNLVYTVDIQDLPKETQEAITSNSLYSRRDDLIGYIASDSNINSIKFAFVREEEMTTSDEEGALERQMHEGTVLTTHIYGKETLYQVIDGNTRAEHLEKFDTHGYVVGVARKLGTYDATTKTLEVSKWMPSIYSPVFYAPTSGVKNPHRRREMAQSSIGHLPDTDLEVPIKDIHSIVTHNTAILGILGVGKSCLAYELIKQVSESGTKVVCIDITNEYIKELPAYVPINTIISDTENAFNEINSKYDFIHTAPYKKDDVKENHEISGNRHDYKEAIKKDLHRFLFNTETTPESAAFDTDKRIRIFNVDYHKASKGVKVGYKVITTGLSQAEKTQIISEELFKILMKIPLEDEKKAKVLLVFEEAHSLIPEWGSVASEDDRLAVNGTAKVILQGRKYGLGCLVITQRTANVSKSILNQCNTIFAMRVFDDTGKGFLANYIGIDYANTLPTLEERHAIAIGRGLRLKQPVIIRLNEKSDVLPEAAPEAHHADRMDPTPTLSPSSPA